MSRLALLTLVAGGLLTGATLQSTAATVVRGPYLQQRTQEGFTVRWRTDVATGSRLRWGTDPDALATTLSSAVDTTEHEVTITGAPADTDLWYAVGDAGGDLVFDPSLHFGRTAPAAGASAPVRIWAIGDAGLPGPPLWAVRDAYVTHAQGVPPDVFLLLGDNAYVDGTDAEYEAALFGPFADWLPRTVVWPARGNHDRSHPGPVDDYFELFTLPTQGEAGGEPSGTEQWFAFDHGDVHFVCFDSYEGELTAPSAMLEWLQDDLAANTALWTLALTHYPPYSKGSHDSDLDWHMTQVRELFVPVLEAGGVDLVLAGHSHAYERSMLLDGHTGLSTELLPEQIVDAGDGRRTGDGAYRKPATGPSPNAGTVYAVVGCSSRLNTGTLDHPAMIDSELTLGSLVLDVDARELNARFLTSTGTTNDWFTIVKDDATAAPAAPSHVAMRAEGNPATTQSRLNFVLERAGLVDIDVVDVRGRHVRTLRRERHDEGEHSVSWDLRDERGERVARGSYFARLRVDGRHRAVARVQVLR